MVGDLFYHNYPGGSGLMSGSVFGKTAGHSAANYSLKKQPTTHTLKTNEKTEEGMYLFCYFIPIKVSLHSTFIEEYYHTIMEGIYI